MVLCNPYALRTITKRKRKSKKKVSILEDAYKVAIDLHVDILDYNVSFAKQRTEMSFAEVMKKFNNSCHFVVIQRNYPKPGDRGEIGIRTMESPDYFLFIYLSVENLNKIVERYKLGEK